MKLTALAFSLAFATASPTAAQETRCLALGDQFAISRCGSDAYNEADAALTYVYEDVWESLTAEDADVVRQSQEAWVEFRDLDCSTARAASPDEPWVGTAVEGACETGHMWDRVRSLRRQGPAAEPWGEHTASRTSHLEALHDPADADLNRAYDAVLDGRTAAVTEQVRQAQRAWIRFRDLDCQAAESPRACRTLHTLDRTQSLLENHVPDIRWSACDLYGCP